MKPGNGAVLQYSIVGRAETQDVVPSWVTV